MKKMLLLIVIIVAAVGVYLWLRDGRSTPPEGTQVPVGSAVPAPGSNVPEMIVETATAVITYTDNGYTPASIKIKAGDTVKFINESSRNTWPASAKHPTHAVYPTTGGCLGSTFDACRAIAPGQSWSFKFDIKGDWKYHDHLSPKYFGAVVVE